MAFDTRSVNLTSLDIDGGSAANENRSENL